jgi:hypothetical protein
MKSKVKTTAQVAKIRLLLADDHPIVRRGILANVKPQRDMTVVAEAGDGAEAIRLIKEHVPDAADGRPGCHCRGQGDQAARQSDHHDHL